VTAALRTVETVERKATAENAETAESYNLKLELTQKPELNVVSFQFSVLSFQFSVLSSQF